MNLVPVNYNTTKLKTSAEELKVTQGTKKKDTIQEPNKTSRTIISTIKIIVATILHESTREWSKTGPITSVVSTERLSQATLITTIETISRVQAHQTMDIGHKITINQESMTGIAVEAGAQVTVPGQVVTIEAVIKTLTVRELLSGHSLNFFKILNLMRCQEPFMNTINKQLKSNLNGRPNKVQLIRSSKVCRVIQLSVINLN